MPEGHLPVRSYLAAPVVSRSGKVIGGLFFGHPDIDVFTERAERIIAGIAAQAAIAIDNAYVYQAAQKEIEQRARAEEALRRSEDKFRRQAEELERQLIASGRLVSVGEITASMAHEFNNPLGIILGFAEEVRSELPPGDHNHRALLIIEEETRRCQKIIQELLQFTRPTGPEPAWTNIRETVEKSLALVANHLYKQKIDLHMGFDVEFPQIYIDAKQLEQVLVNLYLNAIAAMPNGGNLWVNTKIDSPIDGAPTGVIEVKDTGSGIEPHDLPKIFEPFFTAKKRTGLGLGLSVCERILKNHGGRIEAASQPGEGTQVTVHLPVERKAAMIDPG
jgi:signal transduction histidine kinase